MSTVLLLIHVMVAIALVGVVLLQRSEGGALGIGGGGGAGGGFMTGRSAGNALTKTTAILAACFFATSLILSILAGHNRSGGSILPTSGEGGLAPLQMPAGQAPGTETPSTPAAPSAPQAPQSE
ncbi:MAG: preprotein translocase subunit SecG [Hyphomicrobiales bacterium]